MFSCRNCGTSTNVKGLPFKNHYSLQRHENVCKRFGRRTIPKPQYVPRQRVLLGEEQRKTMEENQKMMKERGEMQQQEKNIRRFELVHILEKPIRDTQITETVQQITWESLNDVQKQMATMETTVEVKAHGERALIHGDPNGNVVALMCEWRALDSKLKWSCRELGKAKTHNMFLLGAVHVVVDDQPVYLCHDVYYWQQPKLSSLLEVSRALGTFIKEINLSTLVWKPQHPISACHDLLQRAFPYPTDGLIFTRCRPKRPVRYGDVSPFDVWKWQPESKLTFDFFLGNSSPTTEGLQFRLHVGKSVVKPFNLPGYPSFLMFDVSDDEIPLFTRGRVIEVSWDGVHSKWTFLRFRHDKETPNTEEEVKLKLDLIVCPLPIETVVGDRASSKSPESLALESMLIEAEEALSQLNLSTVKLEEAAVPSPLAASAKRSRAFPLLPPLVIIRDLLPFLQVIDIIKFRRTCIDAFHLSERVRLLENHDAYLKSKQDRLLYRISDVYISRFGMLGFVQQLLGMESVEKMKSVALIILYSPPIPLLSQLATAQYRPYDNYDDRLYDPFDSYDESEDGSLSWAYRDY